MDLKKLIIDTTEQLLTELAEAQIHLKDKIQISPPRALEFEVGIAGDYTFASWDEVHIAKARFTFPITIKTAETTELSPASAALAAEATTKPEKGKPKKKS